MNEPLAALRVKVPEAIVGVAIGELNRIGSWLDESSSDANGLVSIRVRVPVGAVPRFRFGSKQHLKVLAKSQWSKTKSPANVHDV